MLCSSGQWEFLNLSVFKNTDNRFPLIQQHRETASIRQTDLGTAAANLSKWGAWCIQRKHLLTYVKHPTHITACSLDAPQVGTVRKLPDTLRSKTNSAERTTDGPKWRVAVFIFGTAQTSRSTTIDRWDSFQYAETARFWRNCHTPNWANETTCSGFRTEPAIFKWF